MSNNYFQFKQFIIQQEQCAMKVCTDACLFGAQVAQTFSGSSDKIRRILDIGTGTGLLSLMLAQKHNGSIDSVEIDPAAAKQAGENMVASPWHDRLRLHEGDIKNYEPAQTYDLIISNPPFYETDLASGNKGIDLARHGEGINFKTLLASVSRLLNNDGVFTVLLTAKRGEFFIKEAEAIGLYPHQQILIRQTPGHDPFRVILYFSKKQVPVLKEEIIIKDGMDYTPAFKALLKDYYLNL